MLLCSQPRRVEVRPPPHCLKNVLNFPGETRQNAPAKYSYFMISSGHRWTKPCAGLVLKSVVNGTKVQRSEHRYPMRQEWLFCVMSLLSKLVSPWNVRSIPEVPGRRNSLRRS